MTPGHQITITPGAQRVVVSADGTVIADSTEALFLDETGLPTRYYVPREHVVVPLQPSEQRTNCPFKGDASYWSAQVHGRVLEDIAWSYEDPIPERVEIKGRVAFFAERLDVEIDGERLDRPETPWSPGLSS